MKRTILMISLLLSALTAANAQETSGIEAAAMPFTRTAVGVNAFTMGGVCMLDDVTYFSLGGLSLESEASFRLFKAPVASNDLNISTKLKASDKLAFSINAGYDMGQETAGFKTSDMMIRLGAAFVATDFLSIGMNASYASSALAKDFSLNAFFADIMATSVFGPVKVNAGVKSLGPKVEGASLPSSISIGATYGLEAGESGQVLLACDADWYLINSISLSAGASYTWNDMVSARLGYHHGGVIADYLSMGAGCSFKGLTLDLAYVLYSPSISGTMMFGLGYRF